jgi:hypothetical protein
MDAYPIQDPRQDRVLHQKAPSPTRPVVDGGNRESDRQMQEHAENGCPSAAGECSRSEEAARNTLKDPDGRRTGEPIQDDEGREDVEDPDEETSSDDRVHL